MSTIDPNAPILDASVRLDALPPDGRTVTVEASGDQRAAIAERLDIVSVESLTAKLVARPIKRGIEVSGTMAADVTQACVVSFEPVPEHIEEKLQRLFLQGATHDDEPSPGAEVFVDLDGEDQPDHFDGPEADFSEWLIETLSLALTPYPRKPGIEIDAAYVDADDENESPFAALRDLKSTKD